MGRLKCDTVPLLSCDVGESQRFLDDSSNEQNEDESHSKDTALNVKSKGINWVTAGAFIVADIAGGGVVTMAGAILNAGGYITGLLITAIVCGVFCYTGIILGESWVIMCRRWPAYRNEHCRKPYQEMAYRSFGGSKHARTLTSGILLFMLYGVGIVYLLLSSKIINDLISAVFNLRFGECKMLVLLAILLWPLLMCKSPQDFQWAVLLAMSTTLFAVILILFGIISDTPQCRPVAHLPSFKFSQMVSSLGVFMFAFGGHGVFPIIQQDMKNPKQFTSSTILAFAAVCILYIPLSLLAYSIYGDSLTDSVLNSIHSTTIQQFANLCIACHCILTLTIVINPLSNEMEHYLNVPHEFGLQRILVRTSLLATIVFAALTVPTFGPILNLMGGTTVALTSAVFPCLFHLCLNANEDASRHEFKTWIGLARLVVQKTSKFKLVANLAIICLATFCGIVTSRSALAELANSSFSVPCYFPSYKPSALTHFQCCGEFKNVTLLGDEFCSRSI